jgi:integrase
MISYREAGGRMRWEKVGRLSEGISPAIAFEIRSTRLRQARHGGAVKTSKELAAERARHDRPLAEVKEAFYGSAHGLQLKGRESELRRWNRWLLPALGKRRISELAPQDVEAVKSAMAGLAPASVRNVLELLRRVVRWGEKQQLCPALPFDLGMPHVHNETTEFLTSEELGRFLAVLEDWPDRSVARMMLVALGTGLRKSELFRLEDRDIDQAHGLLTLRGAKSGRDESVPLTPPVAALLAEQIIERNELWPGSSFVFPGRGGGQREYCSAARRVKAAAQLPASFRPFHGLRHNYAVAALNSGQLTLDMVGALLTHKKSEVTRRYARFLPATMQAAGALAASLAFGGAIAPEPKAKGPEQGERVDPATAPRRSAKGPASPRSRS